MTKYINKLSIANDPIQLIHYRMIMTWWK